MGYSVEYVTPPQSEPVSLVELKNHLRVEHDLDNDEITSLGKAARVLTEQYTNQRWITQSLAVCFSEFCTPVELPVSPVQSVESVQYYDANGALTTLDAAEYQTWLAHLPPRISPTPSGTWPGTQFGKDKAVRVDIVAGYGAAGDVPDGAKAAIRLAVKYWYTKPDGATDPNGRAESLGLPPAAKRLLDLLDTGTY